MSKETKKGFSPLNETTSARTVNKSEGKSERLSFFDGDERAAIDRINAAKGSKDKCNQRL